MQVESIEPASYQTVTMATAAGRYEYVRYSADNWYVWMGDSLEPCNYSDEQEAAYQAYQARFDKPQ